MDDLMQCALDCALCMFICSDDRQRYDPIPPNGVPSVRYANSPTGPPTIPKAVIRPDMKRD